MERQLKPIKTRSFERTSPMIQNINQRQRRNGYQSQRDTHTHTHHVFDGFKLYKVFKILGCYKFDLSSIIFYIFFI
jgi:hypothetical protein